MWGVEGFVSVMGPSMVLGQCLGKTASVARRCYLALEDERGTVGELLTAPKTHRELHVYPPLSL